MIRRTSRFCAATSPIPTRGGRHRSPRRTTSVAIVAHRGKSAVLVDGVDHIANPERVPVYSLTERGEFAEGIALGREGLRLARELDHPYSVGLMSWSLARLYMVV